MRPSKTYLPGSLGIETKRVGQCSTLYGTFTPQSSRHLEGRGGVLRLTVGWVTYRSFTPIAQYVSRSHTLWRGRGRSNGTGWTAECPRAKQIGGFIWGGREGVSQAPTNTVWWVCFRRTGLYSRPKIGCGVIVRRMVIDDGAEKFPSPL